MLANDLANYNFGDCEIREIIFDYPDALVVINDPHEKKDIHLKLLGVKNIIFKTDSTQNVIGGIYFFSARELTKYVEKFDFIKTNEMSLSSSLISFPTAICIYMYGIAGGDLLCQAESVQHNILISNS